MGCLALISTLCDRLSTSVCPWLQQRSPKSTQGPTIAIFMQVKRGKLSLSLSLSINTHGESISSQRKIEASLMSTIQLLLKKVNHKELCRWNILLIFEFFTSLSSSIISTSNLNEFLQVSSLQIRIIHLFILNDHKLPNGWTKRKKKKFCKKKNKKVREEQEEE